MAYAAQLEDLVKISCGYRSGMIGRVVELSADHQLVRLRFTNSDQKHWFRISFLALVCRPGLIAV